MKEIIQGVIAIVVLIGSGVLAYLSPELQVYAFSMITLIVGYYFGARKLPIYSAVKK